MREAEQVSLFFCSVSRVMQRVTDRPLWLFSFTCSNVLGSLHGRGHRPSRPTWPGTVPTVADKPSRRTYRKR
nr:MAG TPA: hypothetical protein [Caudoviricetes sp.]